MSSIDTGSRSETLRWLLPLVAALACSACDSASSPASAADAGATGHAGQGSAGSGGGNAGAGAAGRGAAGNAGDKPVVAGTTVALTLSTGDQTQLLSLQTQLDGVSSVTSAELLQKHAVAHVAALGYDATQATSMDLIQTSSLKLDAAEQAVLAKNGFVISARQQFPSMLYGYDTIYGADLPVYVSADSILEAVHVSYDQMLESAELFVLIPELGTLLDGMRDALASGTDTGQAADDADFFVAVAKSLLDGTVAAPALGAKRADIQSYVDQATKASGHDVRVIFGSSRDIDFSQFTPRGHYTDTETLSRYFRAMMWLGRIDLRLIETQPSGEQVFRRTQLETAILLRKLVSDTLLAHWQHIDHTVETFVGKSDYMRLPEVDSLLADLGVSDLAGLAKLSDQRIAQVIIDKGYGAQLIASQLIVNATPDGKTLPLDRSFALFGQRYVVDSHVFSNVVYDRVPGRLMPNPLDAAYAALGNDQAAKLLEPELKAYSYAPALERTRLLVDAYDASYWGQNLYNGWLSALRALSPSAQTADPKAAGAPTVSGTEPWGRRILNAQLASWAELRHDTILYVKQSYTSGVLCEFPDAYVDPYPEFYAALGRFAASGALFADTLAGGASAATAQSIRLYFDHLGATLQKLEAMAKAQRAGQPFTAEQLAFINQIVRQSPGVGCGGPPTFSGWYAELFYGALPAGTIASEFAPTIADVHTQPTDAAGNDVGRILHVGTGYARLLVVSVDTCSGAKAYAGLASSYYEKVTEHWQRLTDPQWETELQGNTPVPDVSWAQDIVAHAVPAGR